MSASEPFRDKVVWITGGGSGIGRACAHAFAKQGALVAISGRRADRLEAVCEQLDAYGARSIAVPCDVQDEQAIEAAVQEVVERLGGIDVAMANAGYSAAGRIEELTASDWRRQFDINVVGAALTVKHALPLLRQRQGRVVLIGSVAGFVPGPQFGAYHASKHAIRALGATLSAELFGSGVSCTTVHPGFVASEIARVDNEGRFDPTRRDKRPKRLMWSAERAAAVIVRATRRRRRELVFTGHGKLGAFIGMHFPWLAYRFMVGGAAKSRVARFRVE